LTLISHQLIFLVIAVLRIVVMNTKGGCGKTTVATNLASYCISQGYIADLFDYDAQGSSSHWLKVRSPDLPSIRGVAAHRPPQAGITRSWQLRIPEQTHYVIQDTPAGHVGFDLVDRVNESDIILVPVLPSAIDIHTTANFIRDLLLIGKARAAGKRESNPRAHTVADYTGAISREAGYPRNRTYPGYSKLCACRRAGSGCLRTR